MVWVLIHEGEVRDEGRETGMRGDLLKSGGAGDLVPCIGEVDE
jgi:hypothetical protein